MHRYVASLKELLLRSSPGQLGTDGYEYLVLFLKRGEERIEEWMMLCER